MQTGRTAVQHRRRAVTAIAALVAVMTTMLAIPAQAATTLASAQWGIRSSFQSYVSGYASVKPITTTGTATLASSVFTLPATTTTGGQVALSGGMQFNALKHGFRLSFANLRVEVDGTTGSIVGDATIQLFDTTTLAQTSTETTADFVLGTFSTAGQTPTENEDGSLTYTGLGTTLGSAWSGLHTGLSSYDNAVGDAITVTLPAADAVDGSTLTSTQWGIKSSFQSYVTGYASIAAITTTAPTTLASSVFTLPATETSQTEVALSGGMQFNALAHGFRLSFANLRVEVDGTTGSIVGDATIQLFDTTTLAQTSTATTADFVLGTFSTAGQTPTENEDGSLTYTGLATTLGSAWSSLHAGLTSYNNAVGDAITVTLPAADDETDPGTTDPGTTDPGTTDPGTTDPGTTDPGTTDPGTTTPTGPTTVVTRTINADGSLDLTVTGSGFAGAAAGSGIYVAVGPKIGDDWYLNASVFQAAKWVTTSATSESSVMAPLSTDGTFTVHFTGITSTFVGGDVTYDHATTPFSVLTFAAHGSTDRSYDTITAISFTDDDSMPTTPSTPTTPSVPSSDPTVTAASVTVGTSDGVIRPGSEVTVTAGGFQANETGIRLELHSDPVVLATGLTANAEGVVTATATIPSDTAAGSHTLVLIGASNQAEVAITVAAALPTCTARSVSGATFTWGVRESFRTYVTGPIASGAIATSGISGSGPWTWSSGTGSFNTDSVLGQVGWSGSVQFTGHNGAMDVTLSSPTVTITSASTATLYLTVTDSDGNTSRVAFATLNLAGGTSSIGSSSASWSSVPATLTSAGAEAFAGFYQAGESLDPVSFTLPLGAEVACDATTGALASTGSDDLGPLSALAGMLILGGAGLAVAIRRRRRGGLLVTA